MNTWSLVHGWLEKMERSARGHRIYPARLRLSIRNRRFGPGPGFSRSTFRANPAKDMEGARGRGIGYFFLDHVIGKHLYMDYSVALGADGRVRRVEILTYRESYGYEVANAGWLSQFAGKDSSSALSVGQTLSSHHVTEGVKRILAYYASHLR
jgi:hypothetical protein